MRNRVFSTTNRKSSRLTKLAGAFAIAAVLFFAPSVQAQNVTVQNSSGTTIASGSDLYATRAVLQNGNAAYLNSSFTESLMIDLDDRPNFSVASNVSGTVRTVTAGPDMTRGIGAFFANGSGGFALDVTDVTFSGGKGKLTSDGSSYETCFDHDGKHGSGDDDPCTGIVAGGAIFSCSDLDVTISNATITNNSADLGGAFAVIGKGQTNIRLSGSGSFTNNTAAIAGGALFAQNRIVFEGEGSNIAFSGNTANGMRNDIYVAGSGGNSGVIFQDDGVYSLAGGIDTSAGGDLTINDSVTVTLQSGSVTNVGGKFTLTGDANQSAALVLVLNDKNKVASTSVTTFSAGATEFTVTGTTGGNKFGVVKYIVDNAELEDIYLGAVGNFSSFNGSGKPSIMAQINSGSGVATVLNNSSGIWLNCTQSGTGVVQRRNSADTLENETTLFNDAFDQPSGKAPFTTGDKIILLANANADDQVNVSDSVNSFLVYSNVANTQRTATMINGNRFFNVEDDLVVYLTDMKFTGGQPLNGSGGVFYSEGEELNVNLDNTEFSGNSAINGGVIYSLGTANVSGTGSFDDNTSTGNGGAIYGQNAITTGTVVYSNNTAGGNGGAIYVQNDATINAQPEFNNNSAANGGAVYAQNNITVNGPAEFSANEATSSGGALYAQNNVTINNGADFIANEAGTNGGAIFAAGTANVTGGGTFSGNTAANGAAIYADDVSLAGKTEFANNTATGDGGAIFAEGSVDVTGESTYSGNKAANGAAIYGDEISLSGTTNFTNNAATTNGGALFAQSVTLQGAGSSGTFSGNTANSALNDIYISDTTGALTIQDKGTYSFTGGVETVAGADVTIQNGANVTFLGTVNNSLGGDLTVSSGSNVVLQSGSKTTVAGAFDLTGTTDNASLLSVYLNGNNKVASVGTTDWATGATQLTVGSGTGNNFGTLSYIIDSAALGDVFLGAVGNFSDFGANVIAQVTSGSQFITKTINGDGIWLSATNPTPTSKVVRINSEGETQNQTIVFNTVFDQNEKDELKTGDGIIILADLDATGTVVSPTGVTSMNIYSNAAGTPRTVTMTGDAPFFTIEDNMTMGLTDVIFTGGNAGTGNGGFINSTAGNLSLNMSNAQIDNNTAENGGAINGATVTLLGPGSFDGNTATQNGGAINGTTVQINGLVDFTDNTAGENGGAINATVVNLNGSNSFTGNSATQSSGAISAQEVNLTGTDVFSGNTAANGAAIHASVVNLSGNHSFTDNAATGDGGAIFADSVVFSGDGSQALFTGNTANGSGNDVYVNSSTGGVTIQDNGKYQFGGGINASNGGSLTVEGGAIVDFLNGSTTTIAGMTTIESPNVYFNTGSTAHLTGGLHVGEGVVQKFNGDAELGGELSVTFNGSSFSQIRLDEATSATVNPGATAAVYDNGGSKMTAVDYKGLTQYNGTELIVGSSGELADIPSDSYNSLLYSVYIGYDSALDSIVLNSSKNSTGSDYDGNIPGATDLYDDDTILDETDKESVYNNSAAATREGIANAGNAMIHKMNYLNQTIVGRGIQAPQCGHPCGNSACSPCGAASCQPDGKRYLWFSGYGLDNSVKRYKGYGGYDLKCGGALLGAEWADPDKYASAWFGYGQSTVDSYAADLKSKDYTFGAMTRWNNEWGYTAVLGGFQFNDFDGSHHNIRNNVTNPSFNAWESTVYAEKGGWIGESLNPYCALQYISYRGDGFTDDDMTLKTTKLDSLQAILGSRLTRDFSWNGRETQLTAGIAWHHEFLKTSRFAALVGNNTSTIYGNMGGRDFVEMTAGIGMDLNSRVNVSGDYYLYFNRYATTNAGMGTLTVKF